MTAAATTAQGVGRLALSWLAIVAAGPETVVAYRAQWGLDGPLAAQFLRRVGGFVTFHWGVSFETGRPVAEDFATRVPYSAAIGFGGMALAVAGGFCLGFAAARALAGQAFPAFAVGLVALWILGVQLCWINAFGGGFTERTLLPMLLVAFFPIGSMARLTQAGFQDVKRSPYYPTALSKDRSHLTALGFHGRAAGA